MDYPRIKEFALGSGGLVAIRAYSVIEINRMADGNAFIATRPGGRYATTTPYVEAVEWWTREHEETDQD